MIRKIEETEYGQRVFIDTEGGDTVAIEVHHSCSIEPHGNSVVAVEIRLSKGIERARVYYDAYDTYGKIEEIAVIETNSD